MTRQEMASYLIDRLLCEMPEYSGEAKSFGRDDKSQRRLLRSLMNVRPPLPLKSEFIAVQDELLSIERDERGIVDAEALEPCRKDGRIALWRGDITRLRAGAIVNAANSALLGCFVPCHGCIDNAIHSAAGLQLRDECNRLIKGGETGRAIATGAYNLPCSYVFHTVGPIVEGSVTDADRRQLASCYKECMGLAAKLRLSSIAFCCISTGEFMFPRDEAADIAVFEVTRALDSGIDIKVVFDVFKEEDYELYKHLLGQGEAAE